MKSVRLEPDVISLLPKMVYHLNEPDADPAIFPSYLISKLAREDGTTVLLSGTGGDEVFFGYRSHQAYRLYDRLPWLARPPLAQALSGLENAGAGMLGAQNLHVRRFAKFRRGLANRGLERHMAVCDWSSGAIERGILSGAAERARGPWPPDCMQRYYDSLNRHSHVLIQSFLAAHNFLYTDKTSMAVSVEARVPFMDVELMRLAARVPERYKLHKGVTKYVLKRAMQRYLPEPVIKRKKTGFGAPLRKWINEDLKDVIAASLGPERIAARGLFRPEIVSSILAENASGRADHAYLIYALFTLEIWMQSFVDHPGVEVTL